MRRVLISAAGLLCFVLVAFVSSAQQQPRSTQAFQNRCATCHGATMTGGTGPSILVYVRYHLDKEIANAILKGHKTGPMQMPDAELRQTLVDIRALAGTNPAMATGGYTGSRGAGPGPGTFPALPPPPPAPGIGGTAPTTITMADASSRTGILVARSDLSAVLLENGNTKFTLLSRDGDLYREKSIAPKADWTHYDGSFTGNRYSPLDSINSTNVQRLGPAWMFQIPNAADRILQLTPVVQDGIMYITGWNELYALDATTGRQIWTYGPEPRHPGIVSEAGIGTNRGAAISGHVVSMVTDHAHVLGFNRFTGQRVWDVEMGPYIESYSATSPPLPVGDLLVAGVAGGEEGARGFLDAYRASTGERAWRFYTIPKPGRARI